MGHKIAFCSQTGFMGTRSAGMKPEESLVASVSFFLIRQSCHTHKLRAATCFPPHTVLNSSQIPRLHAIRHGTVTTGQISASLAPISKEARIYHQCQGGISGPNEISRCSSSNIIPVTPLYSLRRGLTAKCQTAG